MLTLLFLIALVLVAAVVWFTMGVGADTTTRLGPNRRQDGGPEPVRTQPGQSRIGAPATDMELGEEMQTQTQPRGKVVQMRRAGTVPELDEGPQAVPDLAEGPAGDELVALVRNPRSLYVYWESGSPEERRLRHMLGEDGWRATVPCLRVFDVTAGGHPSRPGSHSLVMDLTEEEDHAFITQGLQPGHRYVVTQERRTREGRYYLIAHSSPVAMPQDGPGEESQLYRLYGRQHGQWSGSPWR